MFVKIAKVLGLFLFSGLLAVFAFGFLYIYPFYSEYGSWNYKVTVTIETPEGDVKGSSIRNVSNHAARALLNTSFPGGINSADVRGEAVVVDMGERGGLVFVLVDDKDDMRFEEVFPDGGFTSPEALKRYKDVLKSGMKGELRSSVFPCYPPIITFKNLDDPTSVVNLMEWEFYNPAKNGVNCELKADHFPEVYGDGVRLKSIEYEVTDQDITHNSEDLLPLYSDTKAYMKWVSSLPYDSLKRISPANFGSVRK